MHAVPGVHEQAVLCILTTPQAMTLEAKTLLSLAALSSPLNITLHLRNVPGKSPVSSLAGELLCWSFYDRPQPY